MSITFSGLASGLPVNDIIDQLLAIERRPVDIMEQQKKTFEASKTYVDNIENRVRNLRSSIQKLTDGNITKSMDLFMAKSVTSSNTSILTATAGSNAVNQTLEINVLNIATSTKVESLGSASPTGNVANLVDGGTAITALANGTGTAGTFTVYFNGNAQEITVNDTDSVGNVLASINGAFGGNINATIAGGIITLDDTTGTGVIKVGANGDTSNFLSATQLDVGVLSGTDLLSANPLSAIKTSGTITGTANLAGGVTAGTFTLGGTTFTIDATTTLDSLLQQINNDSKANVTANYNLRTNKIEFISKDPGQKGITLGDAGDTSNFLSAVNLVNGVDALAYQTLGNNARFQINNGPVIESTSNKVSDSVTGIKDVTLNLLNASDGNNITVTIQQDTEKLTSAIEKFVNDFNTVISYIDEMTNAKTGKLPSDNSLIRFRNELRKIVTDLVANADLMSLSAVGITTGKVGAEGEAPKSLQFDKTVFLNSLQKNAEGVRDLFLGNETKNIKGIMQRLYENTNSSLDPVNGFFASREESINNQIADLTKSIARALERLESKEKLLKQQFSSMEQAISQLNSQSTYMMNQLNSLQNTRR
jgi:flagellar hook-associated protein 2